MLTIDRLKDETFFITRKIRVTIERVGETRVRLGIEAPDTYDIWREELKARKRPPRVLVIASAEWSARLTPSLADVNVRWESTMWDGAVEIGEFNPDVILLDVAIAGSNGVAIKAIQSRHPHIKVVALVEGMHDKAVLLGYGYSDVLPVVHAEQAGKVVRELLKASSEGGSD